MVKFIAPFLTTIIAKLLWSVIWLMNALIFLIEQLPGGFLESIWVSPLNMILFFAFLTGLILAINTRQFKWLIFSAAMLLGVSLQYSFEKYEKNNQHKIVFYHIPGKSYIEAIYENKAIGFGDRNIRSQSLQFAVQNFHIKQGVDSVQQLHFGDAPVQQDYWFSKQGFIQFGNTRIAFVDQLPAFGPETKIKVDYILFRKWSTLKVSDLDRVFDYKTIILDGALSFTRLSELKQQCIQERKDFYDINTEGALVVNLNLE